MVWTQVRKITGWHDHSCVALLISLSCGTLGVSSLNVLKKVISVIPSNVAGLQDGSGLTALHWAASRGHEACVAALLAKGADPSCLSHTLDGNPGSTAADMASRAGHAGIAAFLSEASLIDTLCKVQNGTAHTMHRSLLGRLCTLTPFHTAPCRRKCCCWLPGNPAAT